MAARAAAPPMPPGAIRVTKPKDGRYTFMVMGSKPEESFPEAAGMLSGKLVYTVYLGIGVRPDWILQYCLPPSAAVAAGGALAAPYPYLMFRPKLSYEWDGRVPVCKGNAKRGGEAREAGAGGGGDGGGQGGASGVADPLGVPAGHARRQADRGGSAADRSAAAALSAAVPI